MTLPHLVLFFILTVFILFGAGFLVSYADQKRWLLLEIMIAIIALIWQFGLVGLATASQPGIAWLATFGFGIVAFVLGVGFSLALSIKNETPS